MKTMQEKWKEYRDLVYPTGVAAVQNQETHQAFFAGALSAIQSIEEAAATIKDEEHAWKAAEAIKAEVTEVCRQRAALARQRN